jgi:5-methylcytosine-specific restriction enzyme subunit McrC
LINLQLIEWNEQPFPEDPELEKGLRNYLEEVWQNRPLLYSINEEEEEEPGPPVQRFLDFKPGAVKARNYIGFIQYNGLRITIEPKVFEDRSLSAEKKIQHLLKWLSYSQRIHFPFLESSFDSTSHTHDWLEAFVFLFANYTNEILSTSPHLAFQEVTEETAFVKGRLAMNEYIHQNLVKGRHHRVYCTYEPFLYDNLFNRVVKHTCNYLLQITKASQNIERLQSILFLLDEVETCYCTVADCDRIPRNRMYPELERITNLCRLFLANQSYNTNNSDSNNLCILLPMEVIFEEFVFGFIETHFQSLNARRQAMDIYLAKTGSDFNTNVFRMKHDILIPNKLIIDTKYKKRQKDESNKGGVNQNDLYQMISYAFRRKMNEVLLLYPWVQSSINEHVTFQISAGNDTQEIINIKAANIDIVADEGTLEAMVYQRIKELHPLFLL